MQAVQPVGDVAVATAGRLIENVGTVLQGKTDVISLAVVALLARGHLLVEDVPGVGKTTLARALARSIGIEFRRLQFTSDLMPADVLGGSVFDQRTATFDFRPGPVFTQVLLADEINRTTPKTQSALLEAMDERQVSIDGTTYPLDESFFVVATQNPEEFYGTYPLPESQLDRFLIRTRIGYPPAEVERAVLRRRRGVDPLSDLKPAIDREALLSAQHAVDRVRVDDAVLDYLHAIIVATRHSPALDLGASTRAALAFDRAVRSAALVAGRTYAIPDDVKSLVVPVLAHRVRIAGLHDSRSNHADAERVLREIADAIAVPI